MRSEFAIVAENISKSFFVPDRPLVTLREKILHGFLSRRGHRRQVLNDVSFRVKHGECVGVLGKNGSGKSSLLKILANVYPPDKGGRVTIDGKLSPFLDLGVGFNPELTARDNIYLNAAFLGLPTKIITERLDQIIQFAELTEFADQQLKFFSSGMWVRLAFAVTVQVNADVFLLDEVLAVGDIEFQKKCFAEFDSLQAQGKTILLVTHDLLTVKQKCNRALVLDNGKMLEFPSVDQAIDFYVKTF